VKTLKGAGAAQPLLYDCGFAREIYALEGGAQLKRCMQCGVCAVSCPSRQEMDYTPRRLFSLIRAGRKEEVLDANTIWVCTSCCTCRVRCPRGIDILGLMHELQFYYLRSWFKVHSRASFQQAFWQELRERGRIGEAGVMLRCWLKEGGLTGAVLKSLEMKGTGLRLLRRGRLRLIPPKIEGLTGLNKIIDKALAQQGYAE
jgi:quinone-modifying oxidoreductase subunit QmoC